MSNIFYLKVKQVRAGNPGRQPLTKTTFRTPDASRGWVGNDPARLDHDRYPRLRAHRYCLQCCRPKPPGLLRCAACNAFDVNRKFLDSAERHLGGEPRQFPSNTAIMAGVEGLEPPTPGFGDRCSTN
jgi:hypothetical protein